MPSSTNRLNGVLTHHPTLRSSNHKLSKLPTSMIRVFITKTALQVAAIPTYPTLVSTLTLTTVGLVLTLPRKAARAIRTTQNYPGPIAQVRLFISLNNTTSHLYSHPFFSPIVQPADFFMGLIIPNQLPPITVRLNDSLLQILTPSAPVILALRTPQPSHILSSSTPPPS
jgi:hypothetical protein